MGMDFGVVVKCNIGRYILIQYIYRLTRDFCHMDL